MTITRRRIQEPAVRPRFEAVDRPEELTHVVCCRDHSWDRALCGSETSRCINLGARFVCAMCLEVFHAGQAEAPMPRQDETCPIDGRPCPDDDELDELIRRRMAT